MVIGATPANVSASAAASVRVTIWLFMCDSSCGVGGVKLRIGEWLEPEFDDSSSGGV
jgi:hypothetical protein